MVGGLGFEFVTTVIASYIAKYIVTRFSYKLIFQDEFYQFLLIW